MEDDFGMFENHQNEMQGIPPNSFHPSTNMMEQSSVLSPSSKFSKQDEDEVSQTFSEVQVGFSNLSPINIAQKSNKAPKI
jgi:hypothetical protein